MNLPTLSRARPPPRPRRLLPEAGAGGASRRRGSARRLTTTGSGTRTATPRLQADGQGFRRSTRRGGAERVRGGNGRRADERRCRTRRRRAAVGVANFFFFSLRKLRRMRQVFSGPEPISFHYTGFGPAKRAMNQDKTIRGEEGRSSIKK